MNRVNSKTVDGMLKRWDFVINDIFYTSVYIEILKENIQAINCFLNLK